jgi:hypothetical protein
MKVLITSCLYTVATVLCLSLAVFAIPTPPRSASGWTQLRSPNFLFVGDATEGEMRRIACISKAYALSSCITFHQPRPRTRRKPSSSSSKTKALTKSLSRSSMSAARPPSPVTFQPDADVNYIAFPIAPAAGRNPAEIAAHELTHLLAREHFERTPAWFDEGFAEYYSTFRRAKLDRARIGDEIQGRALTLRRNGFLPLAKLLAADRYSPYYTEPHLSSIFYAQSWALVHYLLSDRTGARAEATQTLPRIVAHGRRTRRGISAGFRRNSPNARTPSARLCDEQ